MSLPTSMRAWQVVRHGTPSEALELGDVPVPVPGPGQVLLRVAATALGFPDVLLAAGRYQVAVHAVGDQLTHGGQVGGHDGHPRGHRLPHLERTASLLDVAV